MVVSADGSSVLYVYYRLKSYTFRFNAGTYTGFAGTYNVTATLNVNGTTCSGAGLLNCYTMTVKLGQLISSSWPVNVTGRHRVLLVPVDDGFIGWKNTNGDKIYFNETSVVTPSMLPSSGNSITYTAQWVFWERTHEYTIRCYLQNANDNGYTLSSSHGRTFNYTNDDFNPEAIPGFTYDHETHTNYTYNFYYNRNIYDTITMV